MSAAIERRSFLVLGVLAGAGLIVGCGGDAPPPAVAPPGGKPAPLPGKAPEATKPAFAPNAWVRIGTDGAVTVMVDKSEMGQGIETAIPMLVAEELEADWSKVKIEFAPADPQYKNLIFGMQATGGSTTVRAGWEALRKAGAAARMMLVAAAAKEWGVDEASCHAENGEVIATNGKRLGFGALAEKAALLPVPQDPPLKDKSAFKMLGNPRARLDAPDKAAGKTVYGLDVRRPNMLVAVAVRPPVFGGKLSKFDPAKALAVKGVRKVFAIESGVAIVADGYWPARLGARVLSVEWVDGKNAEQSSATIRERQSRLAKTPGKVAETAGDPDKALASAGKVLEAIYEVPYQAHATMEPMNCTAEVRDDGCEVWVPTQFQMGVQMTAAKVTGLPPDKIKVHTTYLGGGFGRRFEQDFVAEALEIAKTMKVPVKLVWSREDDIKHDFYRPGSFNALRGAVGKDGAPIAWTHRIVGPSIMTRVFPNQVKDGIDKSSVEGAVELPYALPNKSIEYHLDDTGIPVGFWRSVGHSQNAFVTECFLDELAAAGAQDPYELRRKLLAGSPRLKAALELAATKAGWGKPLAPSAEGKRGRGIAAHISFGSFVAQVAEVTVGKDGAVKVNRIVCAVDCGSVVNPDQVEAQMEGAIAFGLTAALKGEITIEKGRVAENNFNDYPLLKIDEMPAVEVYIVPSSEKPGGCGEPGTPPVAPSVANAIFAATGKRMRKLPIRSVS